MEWALGLIQGILGSIPLPIIFIYFLLLMFSCFDVACSIACEVIVLAQQQVVVNLNAITCVGKHAYI